MKTANPSWVRFRRHLQTEARQDPWAAHTRSCACLRGASGKGRLVVQINVCDITGLVADLRSVKEPVEVEAMEKAVELVEGVFEKMRNLLKPGVSEKKLATAVQRGLADRGSGLIYPGAVASGERTAFPHAQPSDRCVEAGDLVWFDVCTEADSYHSDLTRTFTVGEPVSRLKEIYDVAYEAQKKAREAIGPGMKCSEVDGICRLHIDKAGYGEYFTHRSGHGLGLEIHEPPYMVFESNVVLKPGMTFTVEPGVYLPGEGGVRIEDDVSITEEGCRSLTSFPLTDRLERSRWREATVGIFCFGQG